MQDVEGRRTIGPAFDESGGVLVILVLSLITIMDCKNKDEPRSSMTLLDFDFQCFDFAHLSCLKTGTRRVIRPTE